MFTNENEVFLTLMIITGFILVIVGHLLYVIYRQHLHYARLQEGHNRIRLLEIEKERRVIAADLHDDIGPVLSAARYKLDEIEPNSKKHKEMLDDARDYLESIHSRIQQVATLLTPANLENKGPLVALEEFRDIFKKNYPLEIDIIAIECENLSADQGLHLFRMLQEIMNNAIRHSKASKLLISGDLQGNTLVISATDNGIGFDLHEAKKGTGLGLENLELRAEMIGAQLLIDTEPGKGTAYTIKLPLAK